MTLVGAFRDDCLGSAEHLEQILKQMKSRQAAVRDLLHRAELLDREMGDQLAAIRALSLEGQRVARALATP